MIYTHVLKMAAGGTASPLDALLVSHPRREDDHAVAPVAQHRAHEEAWAKIDL